MLEIGKINTLVCNKKVEFGAYFDGGDFGEILLPLRYEPENLNPGDTLDLFIYNDSEDRIIATTELPYAQVGQVAFLKVAAVTKYGAFMDWGLMKDLLVPFREQTVKLRENQITPIFVYLDHETERISGSAKVAKYLDNIPPEYEEGEEVDMLVWKETDLGFNVIINHTHSGILYYNEVFKPIEPGDKMKGFIKKIREDEKIDCSLTKLGYAKAEDLSEEIMAKLRSNNGTLNISDKSSPNDIEFMFNCSKKAFKMALGSLYKQKLITIEPRKISLILKNKE